MATITFGAGVSGDVATVINLVDTLSFDATLVSQTATQVILTDGVQTFVVNGSGFAASLVNGIPYLTSGVIASIVVTEAGANVLQLTSIGLSVPALHGAILAEENNTNKAALETLLTGLNYDYNGVAGADVLLKTAVSSDGILLNLRGNDRFNLFGGNDNVFMGDGNDSGLGGIGNDTLDGGNGNDTLQGQAGNDRVLGSDGNDIVYGNGGNDLAFGGAGNDRINGGANDDRLYGGTGRDQLTGDTGADRFVFTSVLDAGNGALRDQILDFDTTEADRIDLQAFNLQAFRGGAGFTGTGAEARFIVSGGVNGLLMIDADGNGVAEATVLLIGVTSLAAGDVLI